MSHRFVFLAAIFGVDISIHIHLNHPNAFAPTPSFEFYANSQHSGGEFLAKWGGLVSCLIELKHFLFRLSTKC